MRAFVPFAALAAVALAWAAAAQTPPPKTRSATPAPAGDVSRGGRLYTTRCAACHSLDANRVGPKHRGVVGRRAGSVADFRYSAALRRLNVVWTPNNLDRWLANPTAMASGTSMGVRVTNAQERADIIAYLAAQTVPASTE